MTGIREQGRRPSGSTGKPRMIRRAPARGSSAIRRTCGRRRIAAVAVAAGVCLAVGPASAHAANVALFYNTAYVNVGPGTGDEATNVQDSLIARGHSVTTFTSTNAAGLSTALAGQDALVIPELEVAPLAPDLNAAARDVIHGFVSGSGQLVVHACSITNVGCVPALLNGIFGFALTESQVSNGEPPMPLTAAAAGTEFAGGPASLENFASQSTPRALDLVSLPSQARSVYADPMKSMVTAIPFGNGSITYIGRDWFNSNPPHASGVDGGWQDVLHRAVDMPNLSINDASVVEGNAGASPVSLTASLSGPVSETASVNFATADVTATAGFDYAPVSGTLTIPRGATSTNASLAAVADGDVEPDEAFNVNLSNPVATRIAKGTGSVTIVNDDVPPPKRVKFGLQRKFLGRGGKQIEIAKLKATKVSKGVKKIEVRCKAKGCPFKKKKVKVRGKGKKRSADLKPAFRNRVLRAPATIQVRGKKAGQIGFVRILKISKTLDLTEKKRCLAPGSNKPQKCSKVT